MAFNAAFTLSTTTDPSAIVLVDVSTGSDTNLTGRTISIFKSDNTLLVPAISWPIGQTSITINPLDKDYALNVVVLWTSSNPLPSPSTYSFNIPQAFTGYGEQFYYSLTKTQTSKPLIVNDTGYYNNKMIFRVELDSAVQAITYAADIYAADSCLIRTKYMIDNQTKLF